MHQPPWLHRVQWHPSRQPLHRAHNTAIFRQLAQILPWLLKRVSLAGSRACLAPSHQYPSSHPCKHRHRKHPKAVKPAMAATATATAMAANPAKAVDPTDSPEAKVAAHAVKAAATDAIAVVDAVDVVAVLTAKAARNASVLTPKASPCRWTPAFRRVAKPNQALKPIARIHAQSALPANVVSVAVAVVVVPSAMKTANATSQFAQKAVPSQQQKAAPTTPPETRVFSPARDVVKAVKAAMDGVAAMVVVPARMLRRATPAAKAPNRPNWVSRMQTMPHQR